MLNAGFNPDVVRVEAPHELEAALENGPWDALISDYSMASFNGLDALQSIQARHLDVPSIIVSGVIGEDQASEAMKADAHDFILKGRFTRLITQI